MSKRRQPKQPRQKRNQPSLRRTYVPLELDPNVIHEDVLWACTTCRACEEQCPVNISYVDKIVQMRRNLVTIRGEFPAELGKPFEGMETNGNPWNLARVDRAAWTAGLDVKLFLRQAGGRGIILGGLRGELRRPREEDRRPRHGGALDWPRAKTTSRSSPRKKPALAIRRGAPATSTSSACSRRRTPRP